MALNSILSFPQRGSYGSSSYRGNCSGHIQKSLFEHFHPSFVVDPSEGSGTSGDVCSELGIRYLGLDLHSGFNLLCDRLRDRVPSAPDFVFWHPPYGNMIKYSGNVWGTTAHPDDLSQAGNREEFLAKMEIAIANIYDALGKEGRYSVLIGDMRCKGEYISWQADIINMGIGKLESVMIKTQHNCVSNFRAYAGPFIPINHEYLLVFLKNRLLSFGEFLLEKAERIKKRHGETWRQIVARALADAGGEADLPTLYRTVESRVDAGENNNVKAKIRQVVRIYAETFSPLGNGRYALLQAA